MMSWLQSVRTRGGWRLSMVPAAAVLLAGLLVGAPPSPASAGDLVYFTDAERTVACEIVTADDDTPYDRLRCDLLGGPAPLPLPPRPDGCPAEWAAVVQMDGNDVRLPQWGACVGDSIASGPAMEAGDEITAGTFRCVVLAEGVRCNNTESRYGFELSHATLEWLRPPAKAELSTDGIGRLRLGMSERRAARMGWVGAPVCGNPQLKRKLRMRAWLSWRQDRLFSVFANAYTNLETTEGVGVGSTLGEVKARHRGRVVTTRDLVDDGRTAYVYLERGRAGRLVFLLQTADGQEPSDTTPVDGLWVVQRWNPRRGFGFDGC